MMIHKSFNTLFNLINEKHVEKKNCMKIYSITFRKGA
jgi:hypothetical protein